MPYTGVLAPSRTEGSLKKMAARVLEEQLNSRLSCVLSIFLATFPWPQAYPYIVPVTDPIRTRLTNRIRTGLFQPVKCVTL